MRRDSLAFLIVGFTIGFVALYFWTKQREPQIVSAMPTRLLLPANSPGGPPSADAQGQPPPVDLAEVKNLQDRVKSNPADFAALVGLGNIDFDQVRDAVERNFGAMNGQTDSPLPTTPPPGNYHHEQQASEQTHIGIINRQT